MTSSMCVCVYESLVSEVSHDWQIRDRIHPHSHCGHCEQEKKTNFF